MGCDHPTYHHHAYAECQVCGHARDFPEGECAEYLSVGDVVGADEFQCPEHDTQMRVGRMTWQCNECNADIG